MNPLKAMAIMVRDLLPHDEQLIRLGRDNFEQEEMDDAYIVVDSLAGSKIGNTQSYADEVLSVGDVWSLAVTLDFYGTGAYDRVRRFALIFKSQQAAELARNLGITTHSAKNLQNVKQLTGQQYGERWQIEVAVWSSDQVNIDTLRIDETQLEFLTEKGLENG